MVSKPLIMWSFSSYSKLDAERTRGISDGMRYVEKIEVKTLSEFVFQCSKPRICGGIITGIEVLFFTDAATVQHDHHQGPYADGS